MKQFDPGTINDTLAVLSRLLNCAAEWGVIGSAPRFAKLKTRQTEIEFLDFDDFERLVDGARKVDPAVLAFVLLAGEAGLRRGEIIALDLTDADFRRGQLTIARSDWYGQIGTTKGGKTRRVPMTTRLTAALQAIRHLRGPRMLYQRNGEPVSENTLRSWLERAERAGGLSVTRPHPPAAAHLLLASRDAWSPGEGDSRAGRPCGPLDDDALHALVASVAQPGDPVARAARSGRGQQRGNEGWLSDAGDRCI